VVAAIGLPIVSMVISSFQWFEDLSGAGQQRSRCVDDTGCWLDEGKGRLVFFLVALFGESDEAIDQLFVG